MPRYAIRITRFRDQRSFQRVAEFLAALYPDRHPEEFEVGLARLPCTVTHDAEESAARALERELTGLGARIRMFSLDGSVDSTLDDVEGTSQEVDMAILENRSTTPSSRAPEAKRRGLRGVFGNAPETPPWEQS